MGKITSRFDKGLSTEFSPLKQPEGTYPYAKHIVRNSQGTVLSEPGTTLLAELTGLTEPKIIGETSIGDEIIYFITALEGSVIAKLKQDNTIEIILFTGNVVVPGAPAAVPVVESYAITVAGGVDPEELSFAETGSALYDVVFTLSGTTASVQMVYREGGNAGDPVQNSGIMEYRSSSKLLPEALRPVSDEDIYSDSAYSSGYGFLVRTSGIVAFSLLDSEFDSPRQVLFNGVKTYTAVGELAIPNPGTPITEDLLGFSTTYPIQAVARKDFKGNIILYWVDGFNIPRRLDTSDTVLTENFNEATTLFTSPGLPRVGALEVIEGGGLTTGLYKFAARLVTDTGNKTTFSQISDPMPLTNDVIASGEAQYDGAPPQTPAGKALKVNISNVDVTYDFIEIAVITYVGEANILTAHVVAKLPAKTSTIEFEYYSESQQIEEVLIDALVEEAIDYATAKHILQKDNHLFLANLTTEGQTFVDTAMNDLVAGIEVHFNTQSLNQGQIASYTAGTWSNSGTGRPGSGSDYSGATLEIDPIVDAGFENYKNPDYTHNFKTYQRDEVYSFALVPIFPGGIHGNAYHIPGWAANSTNSIDQGSESTTRLRGWTNDDGTVHHRMPSITKVPVSQVAIVTIPPTKTYKIIGLDFLGIDLAAHGLDTILEGYTIVRQRRNKPGNGIIVAQGIAKEFFEDDGGITPIPMTGKTSIQFNDTAAAASKRYGDKSVDTDVDYDIDRTGHFAFYAPDMIHGVVSNDYHSSIQEIRQVDIRQITAFADNRGNRINSTANYIFGAAYYDSDDIVGIGTTDGSNIGVAHAIDLAATTNVPSFQLPDRSSITLGNGVSIKTAGMTSTLVMKVLNGVLPKEKLAYPSTVQKSSGGSLGGLKRYVSLGNITDNSIDTHYYVDPTQIESCDIYNTFSYINNVYGSLDTAEYIKVKEVYLDDAPGVDILAVYGGDTFLSAYMFAMKEHDVSSSSIRSFSGQVELTIETRGNYNYRHFEAETFEGDTIIEGTMPYSPKFPVLFDPSTDALGIWNFETSKGPGSSYNKHYHFENTLNKYFPKDISFEEVSAFPNRIIYSLQSFENEQFDAYRTFLTNNLHDIPKETGEITDMFEYNNILYSHTSHSLWRAYVNEKTFTNTTSGEVVLGNGGLFPMPSSQVYTQEGGYAGTTAKYGGINTPFGRLFIDDHQKKVFMLAGQKLTELADPMLFGYFNATLDPADAATYRTGYDPLNKRIILSLGIANGSISYSIENQSWTGFHDYVVETFSSRDNKLIATKDGGFHEMGTGLPGYLFEERADTLLHISLNQEPTDTKEFINFKWIQADKSKYFYKLLLRTEEYSTGDIAPSLVTSFADEQIFLPLGQQQLHSINGEFRMVVPPDNNPAITYTDELWRPRIKGKYGIIELSFWPDATVILELQNFETEYLKVIE